MTRLMSDSELRHRKKVQAASSKITGGLGLAALTGTALATKRGSKLVSGSLKRVGKDVTPYKVRSHIGRKTTPVLATSAGIGGISSFNFAAYTNAEAKRKQPQLAKPKKIQKSFFDEQAATMGIAKNYTEAVEKSYKPYEPEKKRLKRAHNYERAAGVTAVAAGGASGWHAGKALSEGKLKPITRGERKPTTAKDFVKNPLQHMKLTKRPIKLTSSGKSLALAGVSGAAVGAAHAVRHKRTKGSWTQWT